LTLLPILNIYIVSGGMGQTIDPRDKMRFGEDSTRLVEAGARAAAKELGIRLVVEDMRVEIGDVVAEFDGGRLRIGSLEVSVDEDQWAGFKTLLLSFLANHRRPPTEAEVKELIFAATGREP